MDYANSATSAAIREPRNIIRNPAKLGLAKSGRLADCRSGGKKGTTHGIHRARFARDATRPPFGDARRGVAGGRHGPPLSCRRVRRPGRGTGQPLRLRPGRRDRGREPLHGRAPYRIHARANPVHGGDLVPERRQLADADASRDRHDRDRSAADRHAAIDVRDPGDVRHRHHRARGATAPAGRQTLRHACSDRRGRGPGGPPDRGLRQPQPSAVHVLRARESGGGGCRHELFGLTGRAGGDLRPRCGRRRPDARQGRPPARPQPRSRRR